MSTMWRCGVCETVNRDSRACAACGAQLTRRSAALTSVRGRTPPADPSDPPWGTPPPLPQPVERAINREPMPEEELEAWAPGPSQVSVRPIPGGCLFVVRPK